VPAILQRVLTMSRSAMQSPRSRPLGLIRSLDLSQPARSSIQFNDVKGDGPGPGSLRIGTPTFEPRKVSFSAATPQLSMRKSSSLPHIRLAESVRYGYMPPDKGKIYSPLPTMKLGSATSARLSKALEAKVEVVYHTMDLDRNERLTREEAAKFFRKFPEINTKAMFDEVDEDNDGVITLEEFKRFWAQVLCNGYPEEEMLAELDDLIQGNAWVNYTDDRDIAMSHRAAAWMRKDR